MGMQLSTWVKSECISIAFIGLTRKASPAESAAEAAAPADPTPPAEPAETKPAGFDMATQRTRIRFASACPHMKIFTILYI